MRELKISALGLLMRLTYTEINTRAALTSIEQALHDELQRPEPMSEVAIALAKVIEDLENALREIHEQKKMIAGID